MPPKMNAEIINAAIEGFESQKRRIDSQIAELRGMLNGNRTETADAASDTTSEAAPRKRRKFSAAAIARMRAAQKARWAKIKGESEPAQPTAIPAVSKRKRRMSKEGRARIVAATKARWAKVRAEKAQLEKAAKKTVRKKAAARKKTAPAAATATAQVAG
jgi:hypothetical protein